MPSVTLGAPYASSKVLFVEGNDEMRALTALMMHEHISGIELRDLQGNTNLTQKFEIATKASGFSQVNSLGVLCDAEGNFSMTWNTLTAGLQTAQLPVPTAPLVRAQGMPDVTVFVSPNNGKAGVFEDIFLDSVAPDPEMSCVTSFATCVAALNQVNAAHTSKLKIQAFVASKGKRLIGEAADVGAFVWSRPAFEPLIEFLRSL